MKHITILTLLSACSVWTTKGLDTDSGVEEAEETVLHAGDTEKKSTEENMRENTLSRPHTFDESVEIQTPTPIPALILPNNVCIINTDLAPDRTIEEHILACVEAQRLRNTFTR